VPRSGDRFGGGKGAAAVVLMLAQTVCGGLAAAGAIAKLRSGM